MATEYKGHRKIKKQIYMSGNQLLWPIFKTNE